MQYTAVKITFEADDPVMIMDLISLAFHDLGLKGVVTESPGDEPEEGWGDDAMVQPDDWAVTGYFPANDQFQSRLETLKHEISRLQARHPFHWNIKLLDVDEQDWAESWKAYFFPEKISEHVVVKPSWRDYTAKPGDIVLEIDPGMAFGTGSHPTTAMCIGLIEKYLTPGSAFLDIGTGSGILMLAAAKLGAAKLVGIDKDETAIPVARENLMRNGVLPETFQLAVADLVEGIHGKFDLIVANILTHVILQLLPHVPPVLADAGIFVCSGITEENKDKVMDRIQQIGMRILEVIVKDQWVAIAASLP